jgi:RNA polymerase sigma factor (sigma-70 family)
VGGLYDWLRDYQKLEEEITYLEFNLEQTERELKRWVDGDLEGIKLQYDSLGAKVEVNIERIKKELEIKVNQKDKLVKLVETFRGIDNKILKLKYVDGMTLEQIAEQLSYSAGHIRRKHAELVRTIKFVEEYNLDQNVT